MSVFVCTIDERMLNQRGKKVKFEKVFNNKKYIRRIEGMGEGLVLFEISVGTL